jgi:hypothetical protein
MHTIFILTSLMERDYSEDLGIDGIYNIKIVFREMGFGCGLDFSGSGHGDW